jgi:hypothetical protein
MNKPLFGTSALIFPLSSQYRDTYSVAPGPLDHFPNVCLFATSCHLMNSGPFAGGFYSQQVVLRSTCGGPIRLRFANDH